MVDPVVAQEDLVGRDLGSRIEEYIAFGWSLLPLEPRGKEPDAFLLGRLYGDTRRGHLERAPAFPEEVRYWFEVKPEINLGVFPSETLTLVDIDRLDVLNPEIVTPTVRSGREAGGKHLYLLNETKLPMTSTKWGHVNPAYLVLPGSIHPDTGAMYEWMPGLSPAEVPLMRFEDARSLLEL